MIYWLYPDLMAAISGICSVIIIFGMIITLQDMHGLAKFCNVKLYKTSIVGQWLAVCLISGGEALNAFSVLLDQSPPGVSSLLTRAGIALIFLWKMTTRPLHHYSHEVIDGISKRC